MWEGEYKLNAVLMMNYKNIYNLKQHSKVLLHIYIYAGFTILDLSKLHMYNLKEHYDMRENWKESGSNDGKNKKLIWKFKEWKSWLSIEGFVGIRSKCYTFKTKNNLVKKTKGVSKVVVKKSISFDDDKNFVLNDKPKNVKINEIRT
jgi:hypothetical protein